MTSHAHSGWEAISRERRQSSASVSMFGRGASAAMKRRLGRTLRRVAITSAVTSGRLKMISRTGTSKAIRKAISSGGKERKRLNFECPALLPRNTRKASGSSPEALSSFKYLACFLPLPSHWAKRNWASLHKWRRLNSEQAFDGRGNINVVHQQKGKERMADVWAGGKENCTHMR